MAENSRFAVYLVPPYAIARDIAEIHTMLRKQYGFNAAVLFQAHCTIKGFFKKNDKPIASLIEELDNFFEGRKAFEVAFSGIRNSEINIVLELKTRDNVLNPDLLEFRESVVDIVRPYIASDCDFVEADLGNPFRGHITLAFRDITKSLREEVLDWLVGAPVPSGSFTADTYHLLEFFSDDWGGAWWETTRWKLHRTWKLHLD